MLGKESVLKLVVGGSYDDFWKIEKEAPFFRVSGGASSRSFAEKQEAVRGNDLSDGVVVQLGGTNVNSAGEDLASMLCWN